MVGSELGLREVDERVPGGDQAPARVARITAPRHRGHHEVALDDLYVGFPRSRLGDHVRRQIEPGHHDAVVGQEPRDVTPVRIRRPGPDRRQPQRRGGPATSGRTTCRRVRRPGPRRNARPAGRTRPRPCDREPPRRPPAPAPGRPPGPARQPRAGRRRADASSVGRVARVAVPARAPAAGPRPPSSGVRLRPPRDRRTGAVVRSAVATPPAVCAPAQQQHRDQRRLLGAQPQLLLEPLVVLHHPDHGGLDEPDEFAVAEASQPIDDRRLVIGDHRVTAGGLVAGRPEGVEREGVGVGHRPLLLQESSQHPLLDRVQHGEIRHPFSLS